MGEGGGGAGGRGGGKCKAFAVGDILIFSCFYKKKIGFDIPCKLETICMECQSLFSRKYKKKYIISLSSAEYINLSYAEFAQGVVKSKAL